MDRKRLALFFIVAVLVLLTATSFAQTKKLKRIGLYTFVQVRGQVPTAEVMKGLCNQYAPDVKKGFELAGYPDLYGPFSEQFQTAKLVDTTVPVGGKMMWMMFKSNGQVKVAQDIEWAGKDPLPVFAFDVKSDNKIYHFVIPKPCGNIALVGIEEGVPLAVCSLVVVPERANINDPITVDMSGTQNAKSMSVDVFDAQGQKIASQTLSPQSPKWQTKFDKPGEYTFKGSAINMEGVAAANPCGSKTYINFPPICKLWTSCLPCADYVGRPITFDASGSSDPDGQIVKVVFELLDANGNVIDTCVTTRKPWTWEKVFHKAGTYTINVTVFDNDGAKSSPSDPCRLTFEVTQKLLFWTVDAGPMAAAGWNSTMTEHTTVIGGFVRGGIFYWLNPDKWAFTLSAGGGMPFKGDPWRFMFLADALVNGYLNGFFAGAGIGLSTKSQTITKTGMDIVARLGGDVFDHWSTKGSLFYELRVPVGHTFADNWKMGIGFRMMF